MGTRGTVHILDENAKTIASLYKQYDSYPTGLGAEIKEILNGGEINIVNGFSGGQDIPSTFNGIHCLGAYLIGMLKMTKIGNVYLTDKTDRQEYNYFLKVSKKSGQLLLKVTDSDGKKVWLGPLKLFNPKSVGLE